MTASRAHALDQAAAPPGLLLFTSIVAFADTCFIAVLTPLLPTLSAELGLSKFTAGIAVAAFPAGMLIGTIPAGLLASRIGTRRCAVWGLGVVAAASLGFALADSGATVCAFRFIHGLGSAAAWAGALGMLMELTRPERRGSTIGRVFQVAFAGMMAGPLIGAVAHVTDRRLTFTLTAMALALVAVWGGPRIPRPKLRTTPSVKRLLTTGDSAVGLTILAVIGALEGILASLGPLVLAGLGAGAVAIAVTFSAAYGAQLPVMPIVGSSTDRVGPIGPAVAGLAVVPPALVVIPLTGSPWVAAIAVVVAWSACLCAWSPSVVLLTRSAEAKGVDMGMSMAMMNGAWGLGLSVGATGFAALANLSTDPIAFFTAGGLSIAAIVLLVEHGRRTA